MHQQRLVGGLALLCAALFTLLSLVPAAAADELAASPGPTASPAVTPTPESTPSATPSAPPSPAPTATPVPTPTPRPTLTPWEVRVQRMLERRRVVLRVARRQLGDPYVFGAAGPGAFDCSGLTLYCFRAAGRYLPHRSTLQARYGTWVSLRRLKRGDLVFWGRPGRYYHVAIYIGDGKVIVAPHPGARVRIQYLWGAATARRLINP